METISQIQFLTALLSYLVGSIPFGLVLTKVTGAGNLLEIGSGNIGATNVLRTGRKGIAATTLFLDAAKGATPVLIAQTVTLDTALIAGLFAVLGHNFPVWLKFKGGKGVATTLGVLLGLYWPIGLIAISTWIVAAAIFRYSSLAAICALCASPFYAWYLADEKVALISVILSVLGIARHHQNIKRLITGDESRISFGTKPKSGE